MPQAWRIVKEKHALGAFSGEGAAKTGGRWNSRGMAVVYTSGSLSLGALESLVHLNPPVYFNYVAICVDFDEALVDSAAFDNLPSDWRAQPLPLSTRQIGDAWARSSRSAILAVPSVIIPAELNFVLNPSHPDFKRIKIGKPEAFAFDGRLIT